MSRTADDNSVPSATRPMEDASDVSSVALPRRPLAPAAAGEEGDEAAEPITTAASEFPETTRTTSAPATTTASPPLLETITADPPPTTTTSTRSSTRQVAAAAATTESPSTTTSPSRVLSVNMESLVASLVHPSPLIATLPLSLALPSLLTTTSSSGLSTATSMQGFATTVRRPQYLPPGGETRSPATATLDSAHPSQSLSQAAQRANSTGMFTGISLGVLVAILLLLVASPSILACFKRKKEVKDDDTDSMWGPSKPEVVAGRREKDDDEHSWISGSTLDGEAAEKDAFSASTVTMVESSQGHSPVKDNYAGIGRRNTLKSIVNVPRDVAPPQAEFVAFPRTPTIIYSPPPAEHEPPLPFEPPRRILTPQSFPSTPTSQSFPPTPSRAPHPRPPAMPQYPPSTPPLSGLYSQGEWSRILHSPPILSPPSTVASTPARDRTPSPHSMRSLHHDGYETEDDDLSIYSRPSMMLPAPPALAHPSQCPPLPLLPVRLEGLAAAAAAARSNALNDNYGGVESFPVTPSSEVDEAAVEARWRR
ncbi:hypothetical protein JCM10207_001955 [Rhodosporidiobolus poonsookiae]